MNLTIAELASLIGGQFDPGVSQIKITGLASIADACEGDVTFLGNSKYLPALRQCKASAALVPLDFTEQITPACIRLANPSLAFAKLLESITPAPIVYEPGVHPTAVIGKDVTLAEGVSVQAYAVIEAGAKVGRGTVIDAHVYIGRGTVLGEECRIYPHVTIRENCQLGHRVTIHSGTVIGSDGFGYEFSHGKHVKIPQVGSVQIDDDVEIGANVTIDRARFGRTWIQEGTKIDNLVQVAHNVSIGKHSIIVSQVGISGSCRIGNYVTLAGQVGLAGHLEIGDRAILGAQSGVSKNIPPGETWWGSPASPIQTCLERLAHVSRLNKLIKRVKALEQLLGEAGKSSPPES